MEILITNDDGYRAKGIKVLTEIMSQFGSLTVIAPKRHQSGMSMAVSLGLKQIAYKKLNASDVAKYTWKTESKDMSEASGSLKKEGKTDWAYLDATPASCIKFGLNTCFQDKFPDVVVSGINHGSNASAASCYSGTLGAAEEAALNGIPAIGVSLDTMNPDADFSAVEKFFPDIFNMTINNLPERKGIYYNVNFPDIPADEIKGIRVGVQGKGRWVREFKDWDPNIMKHLGITPESLGQPGNTMLEEGEKAFIMVGDYIDDPENPETADHLLMKRKYITIVAHNLDTTDYKETERIRSLGFDKKFAK